VKKRLINLAGRQALGGAGESDPSLPPARACDVHRPISRRDLARGLAALAGVTTELGPLTGDAARVAACGTLAGAARLWFGRSFCRWGDVAPRGRVILESCFSANHFRDLLSSQGVTAEIGNIGHTRRDYHGLFLAAGTTEFAAVLEDTLNLLALAGSRAVTPSWTGWGTAAEVDRLDEVTTAWLVPFASIPERPEGQGVEYQTGARDVAGSFYIKDYASAWRLTKWALAQDGADALVPARQLGMAAVDTEDGKVYALFSENSGYGPTMGDGAALFHANHSNLLTGHGLTVAYFDEARNLLAEQTDPAGNRLHLKARTLLVPLALASQASEVLDKVNAALPENEKIDLVAEPRLDEISESAWYAMADNTRHPVLVVAFLKGGRQPASDSKRDFDSGDILFKVEHAFGCGFASYRGIVMNPGA